MKHRYTILLSFSIILILGVFLYFISIKENRVKFIHHVYEYQTIKSNKLSFDLVKIKKEKIALIHLYYKDKNGKKIEDIDDLKRQKEKLIFAMNAGIFSETYEPLGLYIENNIKISELNKNEGNGNFYLQPNGVFILKKNRSQIVETKKYKNLTDTIFAIQSGPMLVIDNQINPVFNKNSQSKYIRNGVGIDQNGDIIFVISNQAVTFYEFASIFKDKLKCNHALYLDGAISEMYVPKYREITKRKFSVMIGIERKE